MDKKYLLIRNARIINRGAIAEGDILVRAPYIERIAPSIPQPPGAEVIEARGLFAMPGIIDDQVHFREPGLTHKADIASESRAAVAGGVTSFMEMPNVVPPTLSIELLEEKYQRAAAVSPANYSFYMGASNDNYDEAMRADPRTVCGIKIFMGSSTGNMLVDNPQTLERLFANAPMLIATHCEDEATIRQNAAAYRERYGDENLDAAFHPRIRNAKACYHSSSLAVTLAKRYNTRLHVLHITTADELSLFDNTLPLHQKRITAEVCVHHLRFFSADYAKLGNRIKCNPAIKGRSHRDALFAALLDDRLDVIATDHAPHTLEEKSQPYLSAPAGLPLVQHSLNIMLSFYHSGRISLEKIVEKMCHAPAIAYQVEGRGFLEEGQKADIVLFDPEPTRVATRNSLLYKCGWSPLEGRRLRGKIHATLVNGQVAWDGRGIREDVRGERLTFAR
ncbi:MAG: dihydroorotase [Saprospiraceae bacterium]